MKHLFDTQEQLALARDAVTYVANKFTHPYAICSTFMCIEFDNWYYETWHKERREVKDIIQNHIESTFGHTVGDYLTKLWGYEPDYETAKQFRTNWLRETLKELS